MQESDLQFLLAEWQHRAVISGASFYQVILPARPGQTLPLSSEIGPTLGQALSALGIEHLYLHQVMAWQNARAGFHTMVNTGVGSGKSLCYHLPVLQAWLENPSTTALYLFPTKALAQDQYQFLQTLINALPSPSQERRALGKQIVIYDGDTAPSQRKRTRQFGRLILTNPDMLHYGILPYHPYWQEVFSHLRFIILDEAHVYRGAFGSHVVNLIRRLKRIAALYGSKPVFLLTSGTISNPQELAQALIEASVTLIHQDTAPKPQRYLVFYNPPLEDESVGSRHDAAAEGMALANELFQDSHQSLIFLNSRRGVELALRSLRESLPTAQGIEAYRSGYLPQDRRWIEQGLREQSNRLVITTSALELGVDIGSVEAVLQIGYPGSVTALHQRFGRAGRKGQAALGVLIASDNPLDQYFVYHPEEVLERPPEKAILNPNNPVILYHHLQCATYEKPFHEGEAFGSLEWDAIAPYLEALSQHGHLFATTNRFIWMRSTQPHREISLRGSAYPTIRLISQDHRQTALLGEIDYESAYWMVHPGAIYLHRGETYRVEDLNLDAGQALLTPTPSAYYTEPLLETEITAHQAWKWQDFKWGLHACGELSLSTQVKGYQKRQWANHTILEQVPLNLPPLTLQTTGYWISLNSHTVKHLASQGLWTNSPNDYGPNWEQQRQRARARDHYTCQQCGAKENGKPFHVHHRIPFRRFSTPEEANRLENLMTLCPRCHRRLERAVWIRSGLAALRHLLHHLAPLFILCDLSDLGSFIEPHSTLSQRQPTIVFYDTFQGGLGYAPQFFENFVPWLQTAYEVVTRCPCKNGCPACVGPSPEQGSGGKAEAQAILQVILEAR